MEKSSYVIKYTSTFINQFNSILKYLVNKLDNKIAAEKLYNEVIRDIENKSSNPESYEKYIGVRKRKNIYYRIYVKNYTIFYVVKDNTMEVRRILYSKRNLDKFI